MISLSLSELAEAVSGRLVLAADAQDPDTIVSGDAQTDSREVSPGQVFFAKRGEDTDGHRFVGTAIDRGAVAVIVEHEVDAAADRVAQIVVSDTVDALGALATTVIRRALAAEQSAPRIVGITGSNGKTTTKNLLAAMTERLGDTVASEKSFNNEVGGPLTMLRVTEQTRYLVAEMGASAEGEIARLTRMAPPHIGIVLSVGLAHAGEFGGIESTFRAKSEMVRALPADAVAILNREDPRVASMAEFSEARVRFFGLSPESDVWASDIVASASGTTFTLHLGEQSAPVRFRVLGEHHVMNALAAAAAADELGLGLTEIVAALESMTKPARWRMEPMGGRDGITVINDAYNASPDSMAAALKTLALITEPGARSIAVLGEMSELGEFSGAEHDRIGLHAVRLNISKIVVVGAEARRLHISSINEGSWDSESVFFETQDEAYAYLTGELQPGDTVLVKSSNAAGLRFLGDRLGEFYS